MHQRVHDLSYTASTATVDHDAFSSDRNRARSSCFYVFASYYQIFSLQLLAKTETKDEAGDESGTLCKSARPCDHR